MELAYEKLLKEYNIEATQLPQDAIIGIQTIKDCLQYIKTQEKMEKPIARRVYAKIAANDKWVVREILDVVKEEKTEHGELPYDTSEIKEDVKKGADESGDNKGAGEAPKGEDNEPKEETGTTQMKSTDPKGFDIEAELKAFFDAGKTSVTLDELKSHAKKTYDHIWETYEAGGKNGVITSQYHLIETEKEIFTLKKV